MTLIFKTGILIFIALTSCFNQYRVYCAGGNGKNGAIWSNNQFFEYPGAYPFDKLIHKTGNTYSISTKMYNPDCSYWKNGEKIIIDTGYTCQTTDINITSKGDIYVSGREKYKACYWKNGEKIYLSDTSSIASSIVFENDQIYFFGMYFLDFDRICYWNDSGMTVLDSNIFFFNYYANILNRETIVAGNMYIPVSDMTIYTGMYLKNGKKYKILTDSSLGDTLGSMEIYSFIASDSGLYAVGINSWSRQNFFWKNGKAIPLGDTMGYSSIFSLNNEIFIAGGIIEEGKSLNAFWTNGKRTSLPGAELGYKINSIYVDYDSPLNFKGMREDKKIGFNSGKNTYNITGKSTGFSQVETKNKYNNKGNDVFIINGNILFQRTK